MNLHKLFIRTCTASMLGLAVWSMHAYTPLVFACIWPLVLIYLACYEWPILQPWSYKSALLFFVTCALPLATLTYWSAYPATQWIALFTLVCSALFDSGAYLVGSLIGTHKIAPSISPNKTLEGFFGGLIFVHIGLYGMQTNNLLISSCAPTILLVKIGNLVACATFLGDLWISWLKRKARIKDTGSILPGHGGILDRIDGLLCATLCMLIVHTHSSWLIAIH